MSHEKALQHGERTPFSLASIADFSGHWVNQMNSKMELTVTDSDVSGWYESRTSAVDPAGGIIRGILKGYVAGDLISFTVLWPHGSITAWVGQMVDDTTAPCIKTLWHLVTEIPDTDEPNLLWKSTLAGADNFTR